MIHPNSAKTHCPRGHPYEGDNLSINKHTGGRVCRACYRQRLNAKYRKKTHCPQGHPYEGEDRYCRICPHPQKGVPQSRVPEVERFWAKVDKDGSGGCWLWTGASTRGYGTFGVGYRAEHTHRKVYAHRWVYEHEIGPIPEGFQVDHLCFVRLCVNPAHLEAVTQQENLRRARERVR